MKQSIHIIGDGYFGTFLKEILSPYVSINEMADIKILAVPFEAYKSVAALHQGCHLVNVCSVQEETNVICQRYSALVTGFHPLFGPKSPKEGRSGIVTLECDESVFVFDLFEKIGCRIIKDLEGLPFNGVLHDQIMAKTHGVAVWLQEILRQKVNDLEGVPDYCLPPSFKALRKFIEELGDFSPGTLSSIKANRYIGEN